MVIHLRANEHHLPYGITQYYLRPNTGWVAGNTRPTLTPARQASTQFTYPGEMEG